MSTRKEKYHTKSCSVKGCRVRKYAGSEVVLHRFPGDVRRYMEWVKRTGNPKIEAMPIDKIYSKAYNAKTILPPTNMCLLNDKGLFP